MIYALRINRQLLNLIVLYKIIYVKYDAPHFTKALALMHLAP